MAAYSRYILLGSFLTAVFLLQWWQLPSYPPLLWALLCIAAAAGFVARRHGGIALLPAAAGIALALACVGRISAIPRPVEVHADGSVVTAEGMITGLPDDRQTRVQYVLALRRVRAGTGAWIPVQDRVLVTDRTMAVDLLPGDRVRMSGRLQLPDDEEGFSYRAYLRMRGIHAILESRDILHAACTPGRRVERALAITRSRLENRIAAVFPEPASALLSGLLTGRDDDLPDAVLEDFRRTGMSHLTAVSGSNISIVLSVLGGMLFFLPIRWRFVPCVIGVVLFTLMTGAGASVVRAAVTGILGLVAIQTGRIAHARLTILWTAAIMLMVNPAQLWLDMGFQLSFLAVIGIAELRPLLAPVISRVPAAFGLRDALQMTLAAQLTAMPWAAARFGLLSLVSPLANLAAAPLAPVGMTGGFLGVLAGMASETLGRMVGLPALFALESVLGIARFFAHLPFAAVEVPLPLPVLFVYYLLLAFAVIRASRSDVPAIEIHRDIRTEPGHAHLAFGRNVLEAERVAHHP